MSFSRYTWEFKKLYKRPFGANNLIEALWLSITRIFLALIATGQEAAVENAPFIINQLIDLTAYPHMMV